MKQAYIFDMDGTLFQTNRILGHALEDAFDFLRMNGRWSGATPLAEYQAIMGVSLPEVWQTLLPAHSDEERLCVDRTFQDALIRHIEQGHGALYPGAEATLHALKEAGHRLLCRKQRLESVFNGHRPAVWTGPLARWRL